MKFILYFLLFFLSCNKENNRGKSFNFNMNPISSEDNIILVPSVIDSKGETYIQIIRKSNKAHFGLYCIPVDKSINTSYKQALDLFIKTNFSSDPEKGKALAEKVLSSNISVHTGKKKNVFVLASYKEDISYLTSNGNNIDKKVNTSFVKWNSLKPYLEDISSISNLYHPETNCFLLEVTLMINGNVELKREIDFKDDFLYALAKAYKERVF